MNDPHPGAITHFIITVDAETYALGGKLPDFGPNLYGQCGREEFGVPKIIEICDKYGAKATFFVDVYMHRHYGKQQTRDFCQRIARDGHDVQLHAHTSWLPGSHSGFLYDFPLDRQVDILREGKELIDEWVGRPPVAFRAGSYSANLDTIQALARNGFLIDSSYFARRHTCQLSRQLCNRYANKQFRIDEIVEIPVTTYWLLNKGPLRKLSKLDFNACSLAELRDVVPKMIAGGVRQIVLFLHSFSFIRWKKDFSGFVPNHRAIARFDNFLREFKGWKNIRFTTMEEAASLLVGDAEGGADCIPTVRLSGLFPRAIQRVLG